MNTESLYAGVLAMIRQYDKATGNDGIMPRLVRRPDVYLHVCDEFYKAAAKVVIKLQEDLDRQTIGPGPRVGLVKFMNLGQGRGGPKFFTHGGMFYYGSGFGFVRIREQMRALPMDEIAASEPVITLFNQARQDHEDGMDVRLNLPATGALRRMQTDNKTTGKYDKTHYDFGVVRLWVDLLLYAMQALPGCEGWYNAQNKRQMVYLTAKNGEAVLCRALTEAETRWRS